MKSSNDHLVNYNVYQSHICIKGGLESVGVKLIVRSINGLICM